MSENESMRYLCNGEHIADSQILREWTVSDDHIVYDGGTAETDRVVQ